MVARACLVGFSCVLFARLYLRDRQSPSPYISTAIWLGRMSNFSLCEDSLEVAADTAGRFCAQSQQALCVEHKSRSGPSPPQSNGFYQARPIPLNTKATKQVSLALSYQLARRNALSSLTMPSSVSGPHAIPAQTSARNRSSAMA